MHQNHRLLTTFNFAALLLAIAISSPLAAAPVNPESFKRQYEAATKDAEVVAQVRVVSAVCTESTVNGKNGTVTLQLSLQVLESEKGPIKKNDVLVVMHQVTLPGGPGPQAYGFMAALRKFPFTPGVKGSVALKWDKENRRYTVIAGWVPEPNGAAFPTEVGKVNSVNDEVKMK